MNDTILTMQQNYYKVLSFLFVWLAEKNHIEQLLINYY